MHLEASGWIAVGCVDALAANDKADPMGIEFADNLCKVGQRSPKPVELETNDRVVLAPAHAGHHSIQRLPRAFSAGSGVLKDNRSVTPRSCDMDGIRTLRIQGWVFCSDSKIDRRFHFYTIRRGDTNDNEKFSGKRNVFPERLGS